MTGRTVADTVTSVDIQELLRHRAWVRTVARSLVTDDALADDVEQQVWATALERPPTHAGSLRGWLTRVTRTQALNLFRTRGRAQRREEAVPERAPAAAAVDVVAEADAHRRVAQAVMELDEPYRTAVLLRFFHGRPPREIAELTDAPVATVRTRVRRGVERLRVALVGDAGDRRALAVLLAPLLESPGGLDSPGGGTPTATTGRWLQSIAATLLVLACAAVVIAVAATELTGGAGDAGTDADDTETASATGRGRTRTRREGRDAPGHERDAGARPADIELPRRAPGGAFIFPFEPSDAPPGPPPEQRVTEVRVRVVRLEDGLPVENARITITTNATDEGGEAVTDAEGRATIPDVPALRRQIHIRAIAPGRAFLERTIHEDAVKAAAGGALVESLRLPPGGTLSGRVLAPDGRGVPHARVLLLDGGGDRLRSARCDESGAWELAGVELDRSMQVTADTDIGIPARWRRGQPDLVGPAKATVVRLSRESSSDRIDILMRAPGILRIDVLRPDGDPAGESWVSYRRGELRGGFAADGGSGSTVLAPGTYAIDVKSTEGIATPFEVVVVGGDVLSRRVQLVPGEAISGVVVDANGKPVSGMEVFHLVPDTRGELRIPEHGASTTTDSAGRFAFAHLHPGRYGIRAWSPELPVESVTDVPTNTHDLRIAIPAWRRIRFRITVPSGSVPTTVQVAFGTDEGNSRGYTGSIELLSREGVFETRCHPDADVMMVRADGFLGNQAELPGGGDDLDLGAIEFPADERATVRDRARRIRAMPDPTTIWKSIRPLVFIGWGIAAVRLGLDAAAPDLAWFVGVYFLMPLALLYFAVQKRFDDLRFLRLMAGMLIVAALVWGLPNAVSYTTAQFMGWEHGRFAAGRAPPPESTLAGRVGMGLLTATLTILAGTIWMCLAAFLFAWIPGALRRRRAADATESAA